MRRLILIALLGSIAQLVDGTLGMAYGVTASTALLITGISPAVASASVHLAEVGTTLASGVSHWRFGNVDWRVVALIGIPGGIGAFAGATFLSSLTTESASVWVAALLLLLGIYILARFATGKVRAVMEGRPAGKFLEQNLPLGIVAALLIGGVLAAPLAAWLVSRLATRWLGVGVGLVLILTNARTLLKGLGVAEGPRYVAYAALVAVWAAVVVYSVRTTGRRADARAGAGRELDAGRELEPVA